MKIAYFDCFSGASGDMILGSLIDAGLGFDRLKEELAKLKLSHYDLEVEKVVKRGIGGSHLKVRIEKAGHPHRHLSEIREIISGSRLVESVKEKSLAVFGRLAEAEAVVHRVSIDEVHFHEVGAVDAMIDVVGAVAGFDALGIERVFCSPLHLGTGTIKCAHGVLPVPAPATAQLIKGKPCYATGVVGELLTPTGAAILTTLSSHFGPMPAMIPEQTGYGAGTSDFEIPNLLRVFIGRPAREKEGFQTEQVAVLETNIDDMNPQMYDYLMDRTLLMGALDVFFQPVHMKKNRPGTLLTVVCEPQSVGEFSSFLLEETTTIGLRWRVEPRIKAMRAIRRVETALGSVSYKVAEAGGKVLNVTPEYDDCKRIAIERNIPLKVVMEEARASALLAEGQGRRA